LIWVIAYTFHFPEQEIWEMDMEKLIFWSDGVDQINRWKNPKEN